MDSLLTGKTEFWLEAVIAIGAIFFFIQSLYSREPKLYMNLWLCFGAFFSIEAFRDYCTEFLGRPDLAMSPLIKGLQVLAYAWLIFSVISLKLFKSHLAQQKEIAPSQPSVTPSKS